MSNTHKVYIAHIISKQWLEALELIICSVGFILRKDGLTLPSF